MLMLFVLDSYKNSFVMNSFIQLLM